MTFCNAHLTGIVHHHRTCICCSSGKAGAPLNSNQRRGTLNLSAHRVILGQIRLSRSNHVLDGHLQEPHLQVLRQSA